MPAAGDSDNESVLSSLPSSPAADEHEDHEQEQERDDDDDNQDSFSQSDEQEDEDNQSDAETEPLPPTSSAARARQNRASNAPSKRRAILQTESSSSEPELAENGKQQRKRDTLAVPSNTSQLASALSPKSRRMSFDDGSDLSALTSEGEDGHIEEEDEDEDNEDDHDDDEDGPTPLAAASSSSRNKAAKRNVIGQRQANSRNGDTAARSGEDDSDQDSYTHQHDGESSGMDEEGDDDEDEEEYEEEDAGSANGKNGRGRGRPPRRQNALAAAAKRAAARTSSQNRTKDEEEESDDDDDHGDNAGRRTKAEPFASDDDTDQGQRKAKAEQLDASDVNNTGTAGEDDDDDLDPDEQLQRDMLADEAEELAKAARALDDSDDEDYMDPSAPRSRSQQHTSARRRGQIHSGTAKNATRRNAPGYGNATAESPKRGSKSLSTPSSSNAKLPPSPSNRNSTAKEPNSATSNTSSSRKRGANSAKRGAAGRAAAAALRNSASGARHDTEDDDDHMDVASQVHMSDEDVDSDGTTHREEDHDTSLGTNAQITVTDVNGKTDLGEGGNFMSGSGMSLPGSVAASAAALGNAANLDTEDAMSGISEDIPILLKATEQAQAQAAAAAAAGSSGSVIPRLSISTTAAEAGASGSVFRETATPEDDTTAPSTPLLPVPPQGIPSSAGRRKSPAPEGSGVGGRGRGRGARGGFMRGRGKKGAHARMLAAHGDDDEVSTSAAEDHDREGSPGHETGAGSDHEEDTGDASAAKKRQEAIEALTKIEIEFAQLRDKMYLEKMEEVAKERWQIENDVHPESIHLMHLVEHRRTARLELARKNHQVAEAANLRAAEANVRYCWSQWMRRRHDLIREMVDDMNQKRRRLDREKRAIERPRNEELATILRIHAPPPYMFFEKKHPLSYGREYSLEYEVAESLQKKRKRGAAGLDHDEAMYDLERMGLRDPYRGNYPPHYHYDPAYAVGPPVAGPSRLPAQQEMGGRPPYSGYPFETSHPSQHGGPLDFPQQSHMHAPQSSISPSNNPLAAAQGRTVASVSQQAPIGPGGRSDPFSAYRMQTPTGSSTPAGMPGSMHVQAPISQPIRPPSGPRPTLDDHLGYSTMTGQFRPPSVPQAARPGQRFDYPSAASKGAGEPASNKFMPSYYAALGVQRT